MTTRVFLKLMKRSISYPILIIFGLFLAFSLNTQPAQAASASLFLTPSSGTFVIDSTFDVSVYLNTQGESINTIDLGIRYPADKLQLVSTGTGKSIIGLWTSMPKYNNQTGLVELTGGIPGGVNVERGLVTTFTFRVKAVGSAVVKFDRTRILRNDGLGAEVLTQNQNSLYDLVLPAPAGPTVISETHPDQTKWYKETSVSLRWSEEASVSGFSYMISDTAIDVPDEISEGIKKDIVYRNLGDGRKYFHIRSLRDGTWGGTTHYALNIDGTAPADFKLDIIPGRRTTRLQPVIQFETTDALSGADHYEIKIVDVKHPDSVQSTQNNADIFIEARSPYVPNQLSLGEYDVIVRAFDKAGNYREVTERLTIVPVLLKYVSGRGFEFRSTLLFPWWLAIIFLLLLCLALYILGRRIKNWHHAVENRRVNQVLPPSISVQMSELQRYRQKYGKLAAIIVLLGMSLLSGVGAVSAQSVSEERNVFDAPLITTLSKNITNQEIFYVGGKTSNPNSQVILYVQNVQTAETMSETIAPDKSGEWFYRHDTFLPSGNYLLWAQSKQDQEMSPPSPQVNISVEETAMQFGATRVSYATLYFILFAVVFLLFVILILYVVYHATQGRRKHSLMLKEISEAQESLRRGFAVLNRDIQAELEVIKRAKLNQKLSAEEQVKEAQLLKDMQEIEQYISKEIWDVENAEHVQ